MRSNSTRSALATFLFVVSSAISTAADDPRLPQATLVHVTVAGVRLVDNGDHDAFADPNETIDMYLSLHNSGTSVRTGIVVGIATNDPSVDCISSPVVSFGSLAAGETREAADAVTFRVADVARTSVDQTLAATFNVTVTGDGFDVLPQKVSMDLDLNVSGGFVPNSFTEGFEGAGFGSFTSMSLDHGMSSNADSNGTRCQYNDPDFVNSFSYGNDDCYLGDSGYFWHVHTTASPDGGRAYLGNQSLHWGAHTAAGWDTTPVRQLEAIRLTNTINLGWNGVTSELSFKHQVGLGSCDFIGCFTVNPPSAFDRAIVQVQLANSAGQGIGAWRKIFPYENVYDSLSQGRQPYPNCVFDPIDDGNTEDTYFFPTDPERRLGPSSTCYPEFSFSRQGAIAASATFDPTDIHYASDGPGLQGSLGPGTWVQAKFDLGRYRGRRLRVRFLATSAEVYEFTTLEEYFSWNPIEADDGWYIDDVRVSNTLLSAATMSVDSADRTGLPACACQGPQDAVPFPDTIVFSSSTEISWGGSALVDALRGDLNALRGSGGQFRGTVDSCLVDDLTTSVVEANASPSAGVGWYYLVRTAGPPPACTIGYSWKTGEVEEQPGAGGDRDADLAVAPNSCP